MNFLCSKSSNTGTRGLENYCFVNGWHLYLDHGWQRINDSFCKGTASSWCRIDLENGLSIDSNKLRDFPIYHNSSSVSNIEKLDQSVPVDGSVCESPDGTISVTYKKNFYPLVALNKKITFAQCHDILLNSIIDNVESFLKNNKSVLYLPVDNNGIDTLTVRSVLDYLRVDYKPYRLSPPCESAIWSNLRKEYWGFSQVESKAGTVITGFYGDEWLLRNPYYVHILLSNLGIDIINEFSKRDRCYMKSYFEKYREKCKTKSTLCINDLLSQIYNDHQIWHVDDTYFFSPLKHESLVQLLNADKETIVSQVTDAKLSKSIIEKCNPVLLDTIDNQKNQHDPKWFRN